MEKFSVNFLNYLQKIHFKLTSNEGSGNGLSIIMPVCSSFRLCVSMKQLFCNWMGLYEKCLNSFSKICQENSAIIKI